MASARIVNCSSYGMARTVCNETGIAPSWSEYVSKHEVRHFWFCEKNCGPDTETVINPGNPIRLRSLQIR
jgi:hypothetical protein